MHQQIEQAQKAIRDLKRSPAKWLLPEYGELQRAEAEFIKAKERLHRAQEAWNRVGEAR